MKKQRIVLTCEHAGNQVPAAYTSLFAGHEAVLETHRGIDFGALKMSLAMAERLGAHLFKTETSRLLVDCNRSIGKPGLWSEFVEGLSPETLEKIMEEYYLPHRSAVERAVKSAVDEGVQVVHVSVHSFTPVWNGEERKVDVSLLYDPERAAEKELCDRWHEELRLLLPDLQVKPNEPYKGTDDGFTTYLRTMYATEQYTGIEIEVNQKWAGTDQHERITEALLQGLATTLNRLRA